MIPKPRSRTLRWPGWRRIAAASGLGAVMALGQAPMGLWWLTLLALATLTALVARAACAGHAAWLGLFAGAGYFAVALSWIIEPFLIDPERYAWMIPFAVVFLSFGLALFWSIAGFAAHLGHAKAGAARRAFVFAVSLTLAELARGWVLTGFPWALIGHVWIDTPVAQLAAIVGPNGLTLLTVLVAALPAAFLWRGAVGSVAVLGIGYAMGAAILSQPMPPAGPAVVRIVQPNAEQHLKWDPERAQGYMTRLLELTEAAPDQGQPRPDLVIWPETSVPYLLDGDAGALLNAIASAGQGAQVAVGIQRVTGTRGYNSLALIKPDATLGQTYDKFHLVPFGEYIPFGDLAFDLFGLSAFAAQQGAGYSAGAGPTILDLGPKLGKALPLICYEAVFPQDLRAAPARPDWILQITNDAWFGNLTGPWQHLAQARLRAIEQGLPFLRSANTGVSAVIDARGRVTGQLALGVAGHLDTQLPGALPITPYARFGDWPSFLLLVGLFVTLLWGWPKRRA